MASMEALVTALAKTAFKVHYEATKQPHWMPAEEHWIKNPQARDLWFTIVLGVLSAAEEASMAAVPRNAASTLLAKLTRPGGPMTPLPERKPARGPAPGLPLPPKLPSIMNAPYGDPNRGRTFVGPGDLPPGLAIERHDCEPSPEEREAERSKLAREEPERYGPDSQMERNRVARDRKRRD